MTVLPTNNQVPIENVIVAESGDDSDDEWNYIKVNKDGATSEKSNENLNVDAESVVSNSDKDNDEKPVIDDTAPTPNTPSTGEPDIVEQLVTKEIDTSEARPVHETKDHHFENEVHEDFEQKVSLL